MASFAACSLRARIATQSIQRKLIARGFSSTSSQWAAHNFVMPAMSPTMTEGNIASWKVKEGDSFSTGDILLEIETDKAQMDVEAQDDGIMAKIIQQDGAKSVKVGTRIAVLADPDDDIQSLEIPPEETPRHPSQEESSGSSETAQPKQEQSQQQQQQKSQQSQQSQEQTPKQASKISQTSDTSTSQAKPAPTSASRPRNQQYPLYPSVEALIHINGISEEDANQIPATGPQGRLLKGDVLAYLGSIDKSYSAEESERISNLGHLDLTNIKKAEPKPAAKEEAKTELPAAPPAEPPMEIAVPVSLAAVFRLQTKIHESLGVDLPLSTIIARASELANDDLPRAKGSKPNPDDIFDELMGIKNPHIPRGTRGSYIPQITALPPPEPSIYGPSPLVKRPDIIDLLTAKKPMAKPIPAIPLGIGAVPGGAGANNVFSLSVTKGEEKRARVYLERVKSVLESEPGRCVL